LNTLPKIHATTAQFPGLSWRLACKKVHEGFLEPFWGKISTDHVQICPQTSATVDTAAAEFLMEKYPQTKWRLHANARVLPQHFIYDASTVSQDTLFYFKELFARQKTFGSRIMSIHAGYRKNCSEKDFWKNVDILRNLAALYDTEVAIEGLYPSEKAPQWIDTWSGYEDILKKEIPFALDLSHLKIVAKKEGWKKDLAEEMVSSPFCREIHVSENDGLRDRHEKIKNPPKWLDCLVRAHPSSVVFSEGRII